MDLYAVPVVWRSGQLEENLLNNCRFGVVNNRKLGTQWPSDLDQSVYRPCGVCQHSVHWRILISLSHHSVAKPVFALKGLHMLIPLATYHAETRLGYQSLYMVVNYLPLFSTQKCLLWVLYTTECGDSHMGGPSCVVRSRRLVVFFQMATSTPGKLPGRGFSM